MTPMRHLTPRFVAALLPAAFLCAGEEEAKPSSTPAPDKSGYTLFNPTPVALRRSYNTDRSSRTDSPFSIDAGAFQIESDVFNIAFDRNNPDRLDIKVRTIQYMLTNLKVGLTNNIDFQLFIQPLVERRVSGRDFGPRETVSGFGDITPRLKINLIGNEGGPFVLGLVPSVKIPTAAKRIGNRKVEFGLGVPINYTLPAGFTLFAQTRFDALAKIDGTGGRRVQFNNNVGVSRTLFGPVSVFAEFVSNAYSSSDPWVGQVGGGITWQVRPNFSVDVNAYWGVTRSSDDLNVFTGFGYRF